MNHLTIGGRNISNPSRAKFLRDDGYSSLQAITTPSEGVAALINDIARSAVDQALNPRPIHHRPAAEYDWNLRWLREGMIKHYLIAYTGFWSDDKWAKYLTDWGID